MESNLDTKNIVKSDKPKLNVKTISTSVFGSKGDANGEIESLKDSVRKIHGTISQLASHVRSALTKIKALETRVGNVEEKLIVNTEKTFEIEKNIISNTEKTVEIEKNINTKTVEIEKNIILNTEKIVEIDKKLKPESGLLQSDVNKTLVETNKVLVDVQRELSNYFSSQAKFQQEEKSENLKNESKKKLKAEESELKKSSKKLGSAVAASANAIAAPAKGIFESIMEFVTLLAVGITGNAIFEWLKDEENRKKIGRWFNWIKEHWKWALVAIGALAAIPLVSAITGVIGVVSSLAVALKALMGPLLGLLFNPLFLKIALAVGAGILLWKGGEWVYNKIRDNVTGGQTFTSAHNHLDSILATAKISNDGKRSTEIERIGGGTSTTFANNYAGLGDRIVYKQLTPEQKETANKVLEKREKLKELKVKMQAEISTANQSISSKYMDQYKDEIKPTALGGKNIPDHVTQKIDNDKKASEASIKDKYDGLITNLLNDGNVVTREKQRMKGGPVSRSQTYLVGEGGPELFVPNMNGTIINNQKTERIYQMITSKKRGRGGVNIQTLPMQTHELPPSGVNINGAGSATNVPLYSSVNNADPYRMSLTREILGITV